jgi:hypothetical protein
MLTKILSAILNPLTSLYKKREERKTAKLQADGAIALAKQNGDTQVTLTDAQWESIAAKGLNSSWKDEYITVVITSPIVLIIIGAVILALTGDARLLDGSVNAIKQLNLIGINMSDTIETVVFAAVGLKLWRASK